MFFTWWIFYRILDHIEEAKTAKQLDMDEGENIKKQVDMYMSAKQAIEEQRREVMVSNTKYRIFCDCIMSNCDVLWEPYAVQDCVVKSEVEFSIIHVGDWWLSDWCLCFCFSRIKRR